MASCPITEFGFLRVLAQALAYGFTVAQARTLLLRLKGAAPLAPPSLQTSTTFLIFPVGSGRTANYRWSLEQTCKREGRDPGNTRREHPWIISDSKIGFAC